MLQLHKELDLTRFEQLHCIRGTDDNLDAFSLFIIKLVTLLLFLYSSLLL